MTQEGSEWTSAETTVFVPRKESKESKLPRIAETYTCYHSEKPDLKFGVPLSLILPPVSEKALCLDHRALGATEKSKLWEKESCQPGCMWVRWKRGVGRLSSLRNTSVFWEINHLTSFGPWKFWNFHLVLTKRIRAWFNLQERGH